MPKIITKNCKNCSVSFFFIETHWNRGRIHCTEKCKILYNTKLSRRRRALKKLALNQLKKKIKKV